jgi:DNA-directed RNA polymerase subunit RpoE
MFILVEVRDTMRVEPSQFNRDLHEVVTDLVDEKYSNRVIPDVGLCVCVHSLDLIGAGDLYPGDGASHHKVFASLVVFRPLEGEIMEGVITSADERGMTISLGFFKDVWLPAHRLKEPRIFDQKEQLWVWQYVDEEGGAAQDFYFDKQQTVRFRVQAVRFTTTTATEHGFAATTTETTASLPASSTLVAIRDEESSLVQNGSGPNGASKGARTAGAISNGVSKGVTSGETGAASGTSMPKMRPVRSRSISYDIRDPGAAAPVMSIVASCLDEGLGLVSWW